MSIYHLLQNDPQLVQSGAVVPQGQGVRPRGGVDPNVPPQQQQFMVVVKGTSGSVSATVQVLGSNDRLTWQPYGDPVTAAGAGGSGMSAWTGDAPYQYFGAAITALSGPNATVDVQMSC